MAIEHVGAVHVRESTLTLSPSPVAELAAAAFDAQTRSGFPGRCDFIIIAVPLGEATAARTAQLENAARALE